MMSTESLAVLRCEAEFEIMTLASVAFLCGAVAVAVVLVVATTAAATTAR